MTTTIWNFGKSRSFPTAIGDLDIPHGCSITTDNEELVKTLRRYSRLKFVEKEKAIEDMTKPELVEKAKERKIPGAVRMKKADLVAVLSEV